MLLNEKEEFDPCAPKFLTKTAKLLSLLEQKLDTLEKEYIKVRGHIYMSYHPLSEHEEALLLEEVYKKETFDHDKDSFSLQKSVIYNERFILREDGKRNISEVYERFLIAIKERADYMHEHPTYPCELLWKMYFDFLNNKKPDHSHTLLSFSILDCILGKRLWIYTKLVGTKI